MGIRCSCKARLCRKEIIIRRDGDIFTGHNKGSCSVGFARNSHICRAPFLKCKSGNGVCRNGYGIAFQILSVCRVTGAVIHRNGVRRTVAIGCHAVCGVHIDGMGSRRAVKRANGKYMSAVTAALLPLDRHLTDLCEIVGSISVNAVVIGTAAL